MFGNPETTTGGNALKFYSSIRLDIRRIGIIYYMLGFSTNELPFGIQNWQWKSQADLMDECTVQMDMICSVL